MESKNEMEKPSWGIPGHDGKTVVPPQPVPQADGDPGPPDTGDHINWHLPND
jgi:hypothetical protein